MKKQIQIEKILEILIVETKNYDVPVIDFMKISKDSPYKILIATILSARTKDEVTNKVSKRLFVKANNFKELSKISQKDLENILYPVGFYRVKANNILKLSDIIIEKYNGLVPKTIDELILLPGVGRKTANLVLSSAFNLPAICVDTHVHRIMNRIGYVNTKNPLETEFLLRKKLPKKYWIDNNRVFVILGQHICRPISPKCSVCPINKYCEKKILTKNN